MKRLFRLIPLFLWMGLIFFLSAQPAGESAETSNAAALILYRVFSLLFGDAMLPVAEFMLRYAQPIRKLAHFTEFMILGILMYVNLSDHGRALPYSLCLSVIYAVSDEIHQLFVENRYCSLGDILIDSCGVFCGVFLCHLIFGKWRKRN